MRTGLLAQKLGMTRIFTDEGNHVPVTILKVDNCQVVAIRNRAVDGYQGQGRAEGSTCRVPRFRRGIA